MEQQSTVLVLFCSGCTNHMSRATMSQKNQLPSPDSEPRGCQELEKEAHPSVFLPSLVPSHSPQARALQRPEGPAMQIVPVAIWTSAHRCASNVHPRTEGFATDMTPSAPLSPPIFSRRASHIWQLSGPKLLIHLTLVGVASDRYELLPSE